jgi:hypothetical protein
MFNNTIKRYKKEISMVKIPLTPYAIQQINVCHQKFPTGSFDLVMRINKVDEVLKYSLDITMPATVHDIQGVFTVPILVDQDWK